jgi:hypothetical protein
MPEATPLELPSPHFFAATRPHFFVRLSDLAFLYGIAARSMSGRRFLGIAKSGARRKCLKIAWKKTEIRFLMFLR